MRYKIRDDRDHCSDLKLSQHWMQLSELRCNRISISRWWIFGILILSLSFHSSVLIVTVFLVLCCLLLFCLCVCVCCHVWLLSFCILLSLLSVLKCYQKIQCTKWKPNESFVESRIWRSRAYVFAWSILITHNQTRRKKRSSLLTIVSGWMS